MEEKIPPKKARQGRSGIPVLLVLVGGLVLAFIIWGLVEMYGTAIDEQQPVETQHSDDQPLPQEGG